MEARALVEDLMAYVPLPPTGERLERHDAVLSFRPGPVPYFANVSRIRADVEALPALVDTTKAWFAERGRTDFTWFAGPSTTPADHHERLIALGAEPFSTGTAMLLDHEVPPVDGIEVREVSTPDDLLAHRLLLTESGGAHLTDELRAQLVAGMDAAWAEFTAQQGRLFFFLAWLDGEPVSAGGLLRTDRGFGILAGGGTAAHARGRGCYRALVHARWRKARELGLDALAVQASDQSAPILRGLGFAPVAELVVLRQAV